MLITPSLRGIILVGTPSPPIGFVFLIDEDGAYLVDEDGAFLMEPA